MSFSVTFSAVFSVEDRWSAFDTLPFSSSRWRFSSLLESRVAVPDFGGLEACEVKREIPWVESCRFDHEPVGVSGQRRSIERAVVTIKMPGTMKDTLQAT